MAPKYSEKGGGPAVGLAQDFISMLQQGIYGGFGAPTTGARAAGASPMGSTQGVAGVLSDILSGGAGTLGGSMSEMISKQNERDVMALRARYGASGGMGYGTPAAYAESMYRAEAAPRATMAAGQLQMQALSQLLPIFAGLSGKGIAQREGVMTPNPVVSAIGTVAPMISAGLQLAGGNPFGAIAGMIPQGATGGAAPSFGGSAQNWDWNMPQLSSPLLPGAGSPWTLPR